MISAGEFYSFQNPSRYITVLDTGSLAESSILPPYFGNSDSDSDTKEYPDQMNDEDTLF